MKHNIIVAIAKPERPITEYEYIMVSPPTSRNTLETDNTIITDHRIYRIRLLVEDITEE